MSTHTESKQQWGSRMGFLLACLGMCIGTGNVWRFPRVCAANGGGSFVIAWTIAMLIFAVPLLINEMVMGKTSRLGNLGAFRDMGGKKTTWMGFFVIMTCLGIASYYSVLNGYCFRYGVSSLISRPLNLTVAEAEGIWNTFLDNKLVVILGHTVSMGIGFFVLYKGVAAGIEKVCKVLIPLIFVVLIGMAIYACCLPGAGAGIEYLFHIDMADLLDPNTWLQAFTQAAWSTGAGWGMVTVYSVYTSQKEDIPNNCLMMGMGDNLGAIIAGMLVIPAIFALSPSPEAAYEACGQGNFGITFIYMYQLFSTFQGGWILSGLFFITLAMAAVTSLFNMLEVGVCNLVDLGMKRKGAVAAICGFCYVVGIFSCLNINFLMNQDWVWGLALLITGLMYGYVMLKNGTEKIRVNYINADGCDFKIPKWYYNFSMKLVPIFVIIMVAWWCIQSVGWYPDSWWKITEIENLGTVVFQFGLVAIIGLCLQNWFNRKVAAGPITKQD